jgi:hypothetical protein
MSDPSTVRIANLLQLDERTMALIDVGYRAEDVFKTLATIA